MTKTIRWLHLSDMHIGQPGGRQWPAIREKLIADIASVIDGGQPDIILLTGDLAFSGTSQQYIEVKTNLRQLTEEFDVPPLLLPVPGNHDLIYPEKGHGVTQGLEAYFDDKIRSRLKQGQQDDVQFVRNMFAGYSSWFGEIEEDWDDRGVCWRKGLFPGDYILSTNINGIKLGVVGINSAFLHFRRGQDAGTLAVELEQLPKLDLPSWYRRHDANILLMHHPIEWLHSSSRDFLLQHVFEPTSVAFCAFGHMHEKRLSIRSDGRRWMQGSSVFGLENWGTRGERRAMGYSIGRLRLDAERMVHVHVCNRAEVATDSTTIALGPDGCHDLPVIPSTFHERTGPRIHVVADSKVFRDVRSGVVDQLSENTDAVVFEHGYSSDIPQHTATDFWILIMGASAPPPPRIATLADSNRCLVLGHDELSFSDSRGSTDTARAISERAKLYRSFATAQDAAQTALGQANDWAKGKTRSASMSLGRTTGGGIAADLLQHDSRLQRAKVAFEDGDYKAAASGYRTVLDTISHSDGSDQMLLRLTQTARLNLGASLLNQQLLDEARPYLVAVVPEQLTDSGRIQLSKALAQIDELALAKGALPPGDSLEIAEAGQLIQLFAGNIPVDLLDRAELHLRAATLMAERGQLAEACEFVLRVIDATSEGLLLATSCDLALYILEKVIWEEGAPFQSVLSAESRLHLLGRASTELEALSDMKLPAVVNRRAILVRIRMAALVEDVETLDALRGENETLVSGKDQPRDDKITEANELARQGDFDSALSTFPASNHPWRPGLNRAVALHLAGESRQAIADLTALAVEYPGRSPICSKLARLLLASGDAEQALAHASFAFEQLPGIGNRLLLVEVLLRTDSAERAWDLLSEPSSAVLAAARKLKAYTAEKVAIAEADQLWDLYFDACPDDAPLRLREASRARSGGDYQRAADMAWRAFEDDCGELGVRGLFQAGQIQFAALGDTGVSRSRLQKIASRLKSQGGATKESQTAILALQTTSAGQYDLPAPDWKRLEELGVIYAVGIDQIRLHLSQGIQRRQTASQLYASGNLSFVGYTRLVGTSSPLVVESACASDFSLNTPVTLEWDESINIRGNDLLVDELGFYLIQRLGVLTQLTDELGEDGHLVLFGDVVERISDAPLDLRYAANGAAHDALESVTEFIISQNFGNISATECTTVSFHPSDGQISPESIVLAMAGEGWLKTDEAYRSTGIGPKQNSSPGPCPTGLLLGLQELLFLQQAGVLPALQARGTTIAVSDETRAQILAERRAHELQRQATQLAFDAHQAVGRGRAEGWLQVAERPTLPAVDGVGYVTGGCW